MSLKEIVANDLSNERATSKAKYNEVGGLSSTLTLFVGSTIMLTQQYWTQKDLVNDILGIVIDIAWIHLMS